MPVVHFSHSNNTQLDTKYSPQKWLGGPNHHHEKVRWQQCDVMCPNKLISVQFNTIQQPILVIIIK